MGGTRPPAEPAAVRNGGTFTARNTIFAGNSTGSGIDPDRCVAQECQALVAGGEVRARDCVELVVAAAHSNVGKNKAKRAD